MENNFNGALEDISLIKKSIHSSKINLKVIYKLFLINSIINLLSFINIVFIEEFIFKNELFKILSIYSTITFILGAIINIGFFLYYFKIYNKERFSSNKYYVNFLNLFGLIKFIIPLAIYILRFIYLSINSSYDGVNHFYNSTNLLYGTINILFIYLSLNLLGEIVNKKSYRMIYKISSTIVLLLYIALIIFSNNNLYSINGNRGLTDSYINSYRIITNLIFCLIMPLTLKIEERKNYANK